MKRNKINHDVKIYPSPIKATENLDLKNLNQSNTLQKLNNNCKKTQSEKPAEIGQLTEHGRPIAENEIANLCIIDPNASWKVDAKDTHSLSTNNPFHDMTLKSKVIHTIFRGKFSMKSGQVQK